MQKQEEIHQNIKRTLGGTNLRLAQFYKDVELAEVLTDNDADIANILSEYEISEVEVATEEPNNEEEALVGTSSGVKHKSEKKDVLKEIKNGGVGKRRKRKTRK